MIDSSAQCWVRVCSNCCEPDVYSMFGSQVPVDDDWRCRSCCAASFELRLMALPGRRGVDADVG